MSKGLKNVFLSYKLKDLQIAGRGYVVGDIIRGCL
jgi:hypothetical protein